MFPNTEVFEHSAGQFLGVQYTHFYKLIYIPDAMFQRLYGYQAGLETRREIEGRKKLFRYQEAFNMADCV